MNDDELLRELAPDLVKATVLHGTGVERDVTVEVTFGWQKRAAGSQIRAFVNDVESTEPGSHHKGLLTAIELVVGQKRASQKKKALAGLVAIVHVRLINPKFVGAQLEMDEVRVAVRDVVTRTINAAPGWWNALHEAMR